jgi:cytoplasmic tRNA 2-thiolation protein 1
MKCNTCNDRKPSIKRPKTGKPICIECFFECFELEIHHTIVTNSLFTPGEKVCIAASGGKDSTVLAYVINELNKRYNYGIDLFLLSVDEGITGYRDDSLETVKKNKEDYNLPLEIVSYKDLYGWTMDEIVKLIGKTNNCTFCGVFRRQALDRGAFFLKADKIVTGHNADDIAETVLMNLLRGDYHRLIKSVDIITGKDGYMPRVKPFKYTYEKEIVMYAHYKKLVYFSTECIYSPNAYRGHVRELIKDLESQRPAAIIDIIHSGEKIEIDEANNVRVQIKGKCSVCGYMSSNKICKACALLDKLSKMKAKRSIEYDTTEESKICLCEKGIDDIKIQ